MVYTLSYQMYKYEHGLSAAEQRAADVRAGEAAAALQGPAAPPRAHLPPEAPRAVGPRGGGRGDRAGYGVLSSVR